MNMMLRTKMILLAALLLLCGCAGMGRDVSNNESEMPPPLYEQDDGETSESPDNSGKETSVNAEQDYEEIDYEKIRPYEVGQIVIIMYHGVTQGAPENEWQRSAADFKGDLQRLYDMGFRLVSLKDLLENNIKVEAGYTPVAITFDDSLETAFSLIRDGNGELKPSPECAVAIMDEFAKEHPDFGNTATFFVIGGMNMFKGEGTIKERLEYLTSAGHDIGNHTYSHKTLRGMTESEIQEEIAKTEEVIRKSLPDYTMFSLSYPLGERPVEELRHLALSGEYDGYTYNYLGAVREGQSGAASAPNRNGYDPLNIPRARGSSNVETDMGWYLDFYEENPEYMYISDGNPDRISVPKEYEQNVNMESLNGKELYIYGGEN